MGIYSHLFGIVSCPKFLKISRGVYLIIYCLSLKSGFEQPVIIFVGDAII